MTRPVARLHAGLMARKGDAEPASLHAVQDPDGDPFPPAGPSCASARQSRPPSANPGKPGEVRQCSSVRLTVEQRRRLRAAAAALDLSHQDVLSQALDAYIDRLSRGVLKDCACLRQARSSD